MTTQENKIYCLHELYEWKCGQLIVRICGWCWLRAFRFAHCSLCNAKSHFVTAKRRHRIVAQEGLSFDAITCGCRCVNEHVLKSEWVWVSVATRHLIWIHRIFPNVQQRTAMEEPRNAYLIYIYASPSICDVLHLSGHREKNFPEDKWSLNYL